MLICRSQRKSSPLYCPVDLTVDADPGVLVVPWIPLVSRKSKSTTPLCCPVGLTLYIVPHEMHHIMVTSKSKSAGLTLYIVHIIASHDGYEQVQIGYTLWSVDFTVRHVNQICSAICRFHCLMCISMTSTVFKLFLHLLSTSFLSYLQY